MANQKISQMTETSAMQEEDYIPIVQNGENKKVKLKNLAGSAQGYLVPDSIPIGTMMPFGSTTLPANWLECNGQAVSREEYSLLFSVIGTTYGSGDGSTTFNLPDKRGKVSVGRNTGDTDFDTIGETGGEKTHVLSVNEMPSHTHNVSQNSISARGTTLVGSGNYATVGNPVGDIVISNAGGDQAHNNLQPYQVDIWIIKAKQSAGVVANVVDSLDSDSATNALSAKQGKVLNEKITANSLLSQLQLNNSYVSGLNTNTNELTKVLDNLVIINLAFITNTNLIAGQTYAIATIPQELIPRRTSGNGNKILSAGNNGNACFAWLNAGQRELVYKPMTNVPSGSEIDIFGCYSLI